MAVCAACGSKAGLGKKLCPACTEVERARQASEEQARLAELEQKRAENAKREQDRLQQLADERQARLADFIATRLANLAAMLEEGITPYLFDTVRVDSQSFYNESPNPRAWSFKTATGPVGQETDVSYLQVLGLEGWDVVATIPITFGSTLYNTVGGNTVYAAAYGGLVVGAQLIVRRPVTRRDLSGPDPIVIELLTKEFPG